MHSLNARKFLIFMTKKMATCKLLQVDLPKKIELKIILNDKYANSFLPYSDLPNLKKY